MRVLGSFGLVLLVGMPVCAQASTMFMALSRDRTEALIFSPQKNPGTDRLIIYRVYRDSDERILVTGMGYAVDCSARTLQLLQRGHLDRNGEGLPGSTSVDEKPFTVPPRSTFDLFLKFACSPNKQNTALGLFPVRASTIRDLACEIRRRIFDQMEWPEPVDPVDLSSLSKHG